MRWNESHRASHLPLILLCCLLLPISSPLLSPVCFLPPATGRLPTSLSFTLDLLSLLSHPRVPPFSCFLSSLNLPQPSFSFSPIRRDGGNRARYTHVLSRICGSKVFARGGQYSPTTRTTPSHSDGVERRRGDAWTAEEIRFYPAAVAETFFPYLGDNLETGVAMPARESSKGETRPRIET